MCFELIRPFRLFILLLPFLLGSCAAYKQNIMFQTDDQGDLEALAAAAAQAQNGYVIQSFDRLSLHVYTNEGELILDPDFELRKEMPRGSGQIERPSYVVQQDGIAKLPMVGEQPLAGMTLYQANAYLGQKYDEFYKGSYVVVNVQNRRVVVLGPLGGKVVPLDNEGMNLVEVLAIYGGLDNRSKAHNIRLIRGDLKNPTVVIIDLSTIEGMRQANLQMMPNDIVYVEPVRKVVSESIRDISPVISLFTSVVTLVVLIVGVSNGF